MGTRLPERNNIRHYWQCKYFITQIRFIAHICQDITKASARAFRVGGFSYTQDMAQERLVSSMSSNGTLTPFKDGAGWEGTWTLAVCDMGTHNWNTQFGNKTSRYGVLPCCCGKIVRFPPATHPQI
jgi:hypothetical protein